jgi:transglutaminase-like putative cysteine protease
MPLAAELPRAALDQALEDQAEYLSATIFLPVEHPEIQAKAAALIAGASDRRDAAKRIHDWVYDNVEKRPVIGVPNGLEVLRTLTGDCNEHTALYVSLARAAGIPARIAAGVVYAEPGDGTGAFFYHAWPEVYLGGAAPWVPIDPTLNTFPADATHLKLVEGDLDRQIQIVSLIGQLDIEVLDAR